MNEEAPSAPVSSVEPSQDEWLGPPRTKWPTIIGLIALFYAVGGLLCVSFLGVFMGLSDQLPAMYRNGMEAPTVVRITSVVQSLVGFVLGIMLLIGAVQLMRRRRSGPPMIKRWVVGRIVLAILGLVVFVATGPAQLATQRSMIDYQNQMMLDNDMANRVKEVSDDELMGMTLRNTVVFFGATLIGPFFFGFYLSRHKIEEEVRLWE